METKHIILYITALTLTIVSATMTVTGMTSLFAHASLVIIALFIALEATKAVIFGIVFVVGELKHKIPLFIFAVLLIIVSFLGHFSFLSQQYNLNKSALETSETSVEHIKSSYEQEKKAIDDQIAILKLEQENNNKELETIQKNINSYTKPNSRNWVQRQNQPRIKELTARNQQINQKIQELYTQQKDAYTSYNDSIKSLGEANTEIATRSVFRYTADVLNVSEAHLANIINVILSLVIDSLALTMLWVAGSVLKKDFITLAKDSQLKDVDDGTITPQNCRNYSYAEKSVDDVLRMNDKELKELRSELKTKNQVDWYNAILTLKNHTTNINRDNLQELD